MECSLALKYQGLNGARFNIYTASGQAFMKKVSKNYMLIVALALSVTREELVFYRK